MFGVSHIVRSQEPVSMLEGNTPATQTEMHHLFVSNYTNLTVYYMRD